MEVGVLSFHGVRRGGGGGGPKCLCSREKGWRWGS